MNITTLLVTFFSVSELFGKNQQGEGDKFTLPLTTLNNFFDKINIIFVAYFHCATKSRVISITTAQKISKYGDNSWQ